MLLNKVIIEGRSSLMLYDRTGEVIVLEQAGVNSGGDGGHYHHCQMMRLARWLVWFSMPGVVCAIVNSNGWWLWVIIVVSARGGAGMDSSLSSLDDSGDGVVVLYHHWRWSLLSMVMGTSCETSPSALALKGNCWLTVVIIGWWWVSHHGCKRRGWLSWPSSSKVEWKVVVNAGAVIVEGGGGW